VLGQASRQLSPGGRIIAFSSSVIGMAYPTYGPYIASKAGVEGLVHVLANELRGRNITYFRFGSLRCFLNSSKRSNSGSKYSNFLPGYEIRGTSFSPVIMLTCGSVVCVIAISFLVYLPFSSRDHATDPCYSS
jgi:hypothetical protein